MTFRPALVLSMALLAMASTRLSAGGDVETNLKISSKMVREFQVSPWATGGASAKFEKDLRTWTATQWLTIHYRFSDKLHFKFHSDPGQGMYGFILRKADKDRPNVVFVYQPSGGWYVYTDVNDASRIKFPKLQFNQDQSELTVDGDFIE